jgi:hypothetical protein
VVALPFFNHAQILGHVLDGDHGPCHVGDDRLYLGVKLGRDGTGVDFND